MNPSSTLTPDSPSQDLEHRIATDVDPRPHSPELARDLTDLQMQEQLARDRQREQEVARLRELARFD